MHAILNEVNALKIAATEFKTTGLEAITATTL